MTHPDPTADAEMVWSSANPHPTWVQLVDQHEPTVVLDLGRLSPPLTCVLLSTTLDGGRWLLTPGGATLWVDARYCTAPTRPGARATDPDTSHQAWEAQNGYRLSAGQLKVLLALRDNHAAGRSGMIDHDHQEVNGLLQDSAGKRRKDLVTKGLVEAARGMKRTTPRGEKAQVWRITQAGIQALRSGPPSLPLLAARAG